MSDFDGTLATVFALGANFVINGITAGVVIFSKRKAIISMSDMIHATAFGFMGGLDLAMSLDYEVSKQVYFVKVG